MISRLPSMDSEEPAYLEVLRELPDWETKGAPHEHLLFKWVDDCDYTDEELFAIALNMLDTREETLRQRRNYVRTFQRYCLLGYGLTEEQKERRKPRSTRY